jgi:hypothetical protein
VQVAEQSQEMKGEYFTTFMNDVNSYVKDLTKSSSAQDVLGGILALSAFTGPTTQKNPRRPYLAWSRSLVLFFFHFPVLGKFHHTRLLHFLFL